MEIFFFCPPQFLWLFLLSLVQETIFWIWKVEIFDWNPETGFMHLKYKTDEIRKDKEGKQIFLQEWANRKETYEKTHLAWKVYRFTIEFIGIFVGWNLIFFVINNYTSIVVKDLGSLWSLLLVLIIGLIGIAGRIPIIIESVQTWFKR